jgi:endonuclease G
MINHCFPKAFFIMTLFLFGILFSCSSTERYKKVELDKKSSYTSFFNAKERKPYSTFYTVKKEDIKGGVKRKNKFIEDTLCLAATNLDFVGSGYDRGHLKPAAVSKRNKHYMSESFYLSNIAPQFPYLNRVVWRSIESKTRNLLKTHDSLMIYTGVIYQKRAPLLNSNTEIPIYFYKAILLGDSSATIAYIAKNDSSSTNGGDYKTTINDIEKLIQFNLFPGLKEELED